MLGNRMRNLRNERSMSVHDVAELIGKSSSTISRYENNQIHKLDLKLLENIAEVLDTSSAYLLGMTDNIHYVSEIKTIENDEYDYPKTILATNGEMSPEIPEGAHVKIRDMKSDEKLRPGHFYYIEFYGKKCFRMAVDDPNKGVSLMPLNMSEQRIAYDKDFAEILGKVISVTVFYLE